MSPQSLVNTDNITNFFNSLEAYSLLRRKNMVSISQNVGKTKDAADFALTLKVCLKSFEL